MAVDLKVAAHRAEARLGSVINGKWHLDRLLGVGGMACVYAATHSGDKRAAVKMLHPELSLDPAIRERFLREGYVANSVGHRGAVTVEDYDVTADGAAFIVMELLDGETIEHRWQRKDERLPLEEVLAIGDQVLDTLAAAHDKGVVHRDLKPENLFLTRDGVVKVLDFGIGRVRELSGVRFRTQSGAAMGTPAFMASEQARGRWDDVDGQTDLWALGATLFTLLTGQYVHEGETVNETLALATSRPARSIKPSRPDLPPRAVAFIDRALSYAKAQRFPDARSMQAELRLIYAELSGKDVSFSERLMPPHVSSAVATQGPRGECDPRLRVTTIAAHNASAFVPVKKPAASMSFGKRRAMLIGGGSVMLAVLVAVAARSAGRGAEAVAPALASSVSGPAAASASPVVTAAKVVPEPSPVQPPPLSIEQLPEEKPDKAVATERRRKKPRAATTPAK